MDIKTNKSIKKFIESVSREFPAKLIILFGSYLTNKQTENSDIDIAVIVDKYEGDIINANSRLFSLVREIDVRIEPLFLERKYDKSGFIEGIIKEGKILYSSD